MAKITVIGSINMDLVVKSDEIPKPGETLFGNELLQIPGGKGANQAVAMSRLGAQVSFLGKIGQDSFGEELLKSMEESGIDIGHIEKENIATGIAVINVDKKGNNNIVVIAGANNQVDKPYLQRHIQAIAASDAVVLQLEVPRETVKESLKIAKSLGKVTILNPAPAMELDDFIIQNTDILIPNEHELERLSGIKITDKASILRGAQRLLDKGVKKIIVTWGSKGVIYMDQEGDRHFEAKKVQVIDTTAAGDSFIGGFTVSFLEDQNIEKAIDMGQSTAALAIQKMGAQSSIPTRAEVENFMSQKN